MSASLSDQDLTMIRLVIRDEMSSVSKDVTAINTKIGDEESGGLCANVKYLLQDHSRLKRNFWILVAFLVGSGVLGTGIWGILNVM